MFLKAQITNSFVTEQMKIINCLQFDAQGEEQFLSFELVNLSVRVDCLRLRIPAFQIHAVIPANRQT